jgi:molybdenum cofactor cytidylyltransferase
VTTANKTRLGLGHVALVLAAGKGERLGGPKALLAWPAPGDGGGDVPLAIAHAETRLQAECERAVLVVRKEVANSLLGFVRPGIDLMVSTAEDVLGPAGSLATAAARLAAEDVLVVVTPVDTPPASAAIVKILVDRLVAETELVAARPTHGGRGGHPVVVRARWLERFLVPRPATLRDALGELGAACASIEVDDPRIRIDLDTPADLAGAIGRPPRFIRLPH